MKKILLCLLMCSSSAMAWDGSLHNKKVNSIQMDGGLIYVSLKNVPKLCEGGNAWGILRHTNEAHINMLSAILAAQLAERDIDVHSNACSSPAGYCCIGNIQVK